MLYIYRYVYLHISISKNTALTAGLPWLVNLLRVLLWSAAPASPPASKVLAKSFIIACLWKHVSSQVGALD